MQQQVRDLRTVSAFAPGETIPSTLLPNACRSVRAHSVPITACTDRGNGTLVQTDSSDTRVFGMKQKERSVQKALGEAERKKERAGYTAAEGLAAAGGLGGTVPQARRC